MGALIPSEFLLFFEGSPQAMWVFDLESAKFLAVNQAACKRYEYTREELLQMDLYDLRPPGDRPRVEAALERIRQVGWPQKPTVWEHRTKSGKRLFVEVLSHVVPIGARKVIFAVLRDVTVERELKAEQSQFFELSQDIMAIRHLDGSLISINVAATKILGWSLEEMGGFTPEALVHPDDLPILRGAWDRATHSTESTTWEVRVKTKQGGFRWIQFHATSDHERKRAYAVGRDVTERRTITERLKESEADLAWAQEVSHLGSWSLHIGDRLFSLSDEYYRITGYEPNGFEPTWDNVAGCVHPEDRHLVETNDVPTGATWQPQRLEVRILRPNGEVRNVRSYVDAIFDENGLLTAMHGTIQDITEAKQAEETQKWLAEIVASSSDAIIGKSLDGIVLSWNKAAERLYGYAATEIVGHSVDRLIPAHRKGELVNILSRLRLGERVEEFETERVNAKGRIFEATVTVSPVRADGGKIIGAATIARDISLRKERERQLAHRLAQLSALRRIDLSIAGTFSLELTLQIVAAQTLSTTRADTVGVFVRDRSDGSLPLLASISEDPNGVAAEFLAVAEELADRILATNAPDPLGWLSNAVHSHAGIPEENGMCEVRPLIAKGEIVGVLAVHFAQGAKRSSEEAQFLEMLAGQAAIAVQSSWLFQDLQRSHDDLQAAYDQTLEGWARALDLRDHETVGHSRRVTDLTVRMAERLGLTGDDLLNVRRGALLHDIGKLGIPDNILLKPGSLSDEEWVLMRKHPTLGRDILAPIAFLGPALEIPYCHHEKWDGSGYPQGLKGEEIPLSARLFAFADVWDALASDRPYRKGWPVEKVREHLVAESGRHFDPGLTPIFLEMMGASGSEASGSGQAKR